MTEKAHFTWLHLSDIHMGHGSAAYNSNQVLILRELYKDVMGRRTFGVPKIDAILVTGDIAFSGNCARRGRGRANEYQEAARWLCSVAKAVRVPPERIYPVPGNHDIQRWSTDRLLRSRLLRKVRQSPERLDAALGDKAHSLLLRKGLRNYLSFTSHFAPACRRQLWWTDQIVSRRKHIALVGLNTALLSNDDKDWGRLCIGQRQIAKTFAMSAPTLVDQFVIVLGHHPLSGGWLADEKDIVRYLAENADLHLFGHLHDPDAVRIERADGRRFIRVHAGAVHEQNHGRRVTSDADAATTSLMARG